jgi:hypothetical protein
MESFSWIDSSEKFQSESASLVQNNSKHTNTNTAIRSLIQSIKHNNQLHDGALSWKIELLSRPRTSTSLIGVKACYLLDKTPSLDPVLRQFNPRRTQHFKLALFFVQATVFQLVLLYSDLPYACYMANRLIRLNLNT